jgi:hypothetical protein
MKLKTLVAAMLLSSSAAFAQNFSLSESGWESVSGQTLTGEQTFQAGPNAWAISPYTGTTMYSLQPQAPSNTYANMASALGMSSASVSALNAEIAAQNPMGGGNITNAAWVSKNFTFSSAATFKMAWVYTSTDYVPFNDGSITTLVNTGNASTFGKINGVSTQYLLLGATNPGTGNYSTDSYGSTGWQQVNYQVITPGTYKLGFAVFNQGDTALSPVLNVNDNLGTVKQNGTIINAVAPNNPDMPSVVTPPAPTAPTVTNTIVADNVTTSTSYGNSTVTNDIAYGAATVTVEQANAKGDRTSKVLNVIQTTAVTTVTPFVLTHTTTTPVTTTTNTTPVTTKTWSDGTTTTENGTTTTTSSTTNSVTTTSTNGQEVIEVDTQKNYTTRIDQFDQLGNINSRINASLDSDPLARSGVSDGYIYSRTHDNREVNFYINGNGQKSNTSDGYSYNGSTYGFGADKRIDSTFLVGAQYNHTNAALNGNDSNGNLGKDSFGLYAMKTVKDFIIKGDLGYAINKYNTAHNLPELGLSNTASANGKDKWAAVRVYSPSFGYFRPFVGGRVENNIRGSALDNGSAVSAVSYDALNTTKTSGVGGVRYENPITNDWTLVAEASHATNQLNTLNLSALYATSNNSSVVAKVGRQQQNGVAANQVMLLGRVNF